MEKNWDEIEELAKEYAIENITNRNMNCSESVFEALIRSGAVEVPTGVEAVAFATGFGSGGGGSGFTCGALTAAMLANSIAHGRKTPYNNNNRFELKESYYQRYNNIISEFIKTAGGGLCRDIINAFPEGYNDDGTRPNCIRIVGEAAKIAVEYLQKDAEEAAQLEYDPSIVGIKNWL